MGSAIKEFPLHEIQGSYEFKMIHSVITPASPKMPENEAVSVEWIVFSN